ncbi:DUF5681 domain-containing protein [Bradyrhizobium erythrophlei]|uniref:DUF5681 domain-containing protein n=1 Tax=Bradyrhizobium erythrophlei TaxID=1437360 RepID=A0A1M7T705_9BRAD|nr:DUF5681 domain-containing protein [Bradyrhizobium erythrophlei]SHN66521.1 hypothetical protein SAMN05444170_0971 [Bradyrhizobium erythrophlei]
MTEPDSTGRKQSGRFAKGQSGNPAGRPQGSRNATTLALESLLDGQARALTQKAIDLALAGDLTALRICLDRILPPRKDRPVTFNFPVITRISEAANTMSAVLTAVAAGEITPAEAAEISKLVDTYVKAVEATDLSERIEKLERMTNQ